MAHASTINQLADGLVRCVAGNSGEDGSFSRMRDQAVKTLRHSNYARTNQFDVKSKLDGMIEKFTVLNRDDLATALQIRLDELPQESKWLPEILSLLLHLSDRPLEKTKVADVEALAVMSEGHQPELSWADIVADDPLDEDGILDDVERDYHSSDDAMSEGSEGDSFGTTSTDATSAGEEDIATLARLQIVHPNDSALHEIRGSRTHTGDGGLSELALIREILFMLRSLPSTIFVPIGSNGPISLHSSSLLETVTEPTTSNLLSQFAVIGSSLNTLRRWIQSEQRLSYLQSCQASAQQLLMNFNHRLAEIEQNYLSPRKDTVISVIDVWSEVENCSRSLLRLASIVESTERRMQSSPFALLDALYDEICIAEMSSDALPFTALTRVLYAGIRSYLKPVSTWIQTGTVHRSIDTFFVRDANPECDRGRLWYDRFAMRTLSNDCLSAPKFMHDFGTNVFAMGKSRAFLTALSANSIAHESTYTSPDFTSIETRLSEQPLLPFPQLLRETLESWIAQTGKDYTPLLRRRLLVEHGLLKTIDELEKVFCSQNGLVFQTFAETLFWRMDNERRSWTNTFLLGELAQSTLANGNSVDAETLSVRTNEDFGTDSSSSSIRQLEAANVEYHFSWPIQNITCSPLSSTYTQVCTLLLQVYRARYLLRPGLFDLRFLSSRRSELSQIVTAALHLRQRLLTTIDILQNHISSTSRVLSTSLRENIQIADGIDGMAMVWKAHDKQFETSLLLAHNLRPIKEAIIGQLELCELFAKVWARLVAHVASSTSSETEGEEDSGRDHEQLHGLIPSKDDFSEIRGKFNQLLSFVVTGVRSISRASGNAGLEALAERLEWSVH